MFNYCLEKTFLKNIFKMSFLKLMWCCITLLCCNTVIPLFKPCITVGCGPKLSVAPVTASNSDVVLQRSALWSALLHTVWTEHVAAATWQYKLDIQPECSWSLKQIFIKTNKLCPNVIFLFMNVLNKPWSLSACEATSCLLSSALIIELWFVR